MRYATLQDHIGCDKAAGIERAASLGLDGIELIVPDGIHDVGPHGMALDPAGTDLEGDAIWSSAGRERLRALADDNGVTLTSLCPSYLNFYPGVTAADPDERADAVAELRRLVDAAADLGVGLVLVPFFLEAEIGTADERRRVADTIQPVVERAEDAGVILGLETSLPADENRALIERIHSSHARVYYDVGNATGFGHDPAEELRELSDVLAPRVHLKDGEGSAAGSMLGDGRVDFEGVADALADVGYDDWLVLETMYRDDPLEDMAANLRFARDRFG